VSALILDSGALVAVDRDDRATVARLRAAEQHGLELRSNAMVIAQVWCDRPRAPGTGPSLSPVKRRARTTGGKKKRPRTGTGSQ